MYTVNSFFVTTITKSVGILDNIIPDNLAGADDTVQGASLLEVLIKNGITLLFVLIVIFGLIYAVLAAMKYVQSQGQADQVEEAREALKNIFIGIIATFVGVLAIFALSSFFGNGGTLDSSLKCLFTLTC